MQASAYKDNSPLELNSLVAFALSRWKLALALTVTTCVLGSLAYYSLAPYRLRTTLLINDAQTSQLQAFTNNFFALSKVQSNARKNQTPAAKAIDLLERQDTFTGFLRFLATRAAADGATPETIKGFALLEKALGLAGKREGSVNLRQSASALRQMIRLSASGQMEISLGVSTGNRNLTYYLANEYSQFALDSLKQAAEAEIEQVRLAIASQRDRFKSQFEQSTKDLVEFQSRPENVLSLASGASVSNYISDLVVRQNDIELKIAENVRTIEFLGGSKAAALAARRNLGQRSQAQQLLEETALLRKQAHAIQDSIRKFTSATNGAAVAARMQDELKKTADREFKNFQEASDLLSKLEVYAVSIAKKFEILEAAEAEEVRRAGSLPLALAVSVLLAQFAFASVVYYRWTLQAEAGARLRRPREVAAISPAAGAVKLRQDAVAVAELHK